jgi:putative sterol carrier protein
MAYFASADEVYETLGQLAQDAAVSGGLGPQLQQTNASVKLALSEPVATITVAFSEGKDPVVAFGDSGRDATLTLEMSTDAAHEIFLGKLDLFEAAGDGRLKQQGSKESFVAAWPANVFALPARYAQILAATGHDDLADIEASLPVEDPSLLNRRL